MGITLYKPGTGSIVRGIECESKTFDENYYKSNLDAGWFLSPEKCYEIDLTDPMVSEFNEKTNEEIKEMVDDIEVEKSIPLREKSIPAENIDPGKFFGGVPTLLKRPPSTNDLSDDEIRAIAKEKIIPNWHVKSIKRLKVEIA